MSYSLTYYLKEGIVFIPLAVIGFIMIFYYAKRLSNIGKVEEWFGLNIVRDVVMLLTWEKEIFVLNVEEKILKCRRSWNERWRKKNKSYRIY